MNLAHFTAILQHEEAIYRQQAAQVFDMVEDVDALPAVATAYKQETDPAARAAMKKAGKRLYDTKQAGVTALDVIFELFNINAELNQQLSPEEARLLRDMQSNLHTELLQMRKSGMRGNVGWGLAAGLAGGVAGGGMMAGLSTLSLAMRSASNFGGLSSDLMGTGGAPRRVPPTKPTTAAYQIWADRLASEDDSTVRITAVREILNRNNPAGLPALAQAYLHDPEETVRNKAERAGKQLYWKMRYWNLAADGTIAREFERRAAELAEQAEQTEDEQAIQQKDNAARQASPEEIARILAEAERKKRKRRR